MWFLEQKERMISSEHWNRTLNDLNWTVLDLKSILNWSGMNIAWSGVKITLSGMSIACFGVNIKWWRFYSVPYRRIAPLSGSVCGSCRQHSSSEFLCTIDTLSMGSGRALLTLRCVSIYYQVSMVDGLMIAWSCGGIVVTWDIPDLDRFSDCATDSSSHENCLNSPESLVCTRSAWVTAVSLLGHVVICSSRETFFIGKIFRWSALHRMKCICTDFGIVLAPGQRGWSLSHLRVTWWQRDRVESSPVGGIGSQNQRIRGTLCAAAALRALAFFRNYLFNKRARDCVRTRVWDACSTLQHSCKRVSHFVFACLNLTFFVIRFVCVCL